MATQCECVGSGCSPEDEPTGICQLEKGGYCFAYVDADRGEKDWIMGCLPGDIEGLLQCKGGLTRHHSAKAMKCCQDKDFCNYELTQEVEKVFDIDVETREFENAQNYNRTMFVACSAGLAIIIILLIISFIFHLYRKYKRSGCHDYENNKPLSNSKDISQIEQQYGGEPLLESNDNLFPGKVFPAYQRTFCFLPNRGSSSQDSAPWMVPNNLGFKYGHLPSTIGSHASSSLSSNATQQTMIHSSGNMPTVTEDSCNSGTRGNFLREKTISQQCELIRNIGKGRFSRVWLANRFKENIAVKIYMSRHMKAWEQEVKCYMLSNMRNNFILRHIACDHTSVREGDVELWLMSEYLPLGSLYDYMQNHPIGSIEQMLSLYRCIVSGLFHLHRLFRGELVTYGIAHRDLKSTTIMMRSPTMCCISDFGLSVISDESGHCEPPATGVQPYPRYMAPECLNKTLTPNIFREHCFADVYSLGLVFWEICNRLNFNGTANKHSLPYDDIVEEISPDDMVRKLRTVVCEQQRRPQWDPRFQTDNRLIKVQNLVRECWFSNPGARVPVLRIKFQVENLLSPEQ